MRWNTGSGCLRPPSHLQGGNRLSRLTRPGNGLWSGLWQVWTSPWRIFRQNPGLCRSQGLCGGNRTGEKAAFRSGGAKSSGNTASTIRPGAAANSAKLHRLPAVPSLTELTGNLILLELELVDVVAILLQTEENGNREIGSSGAEIPCAALWVIRKALGV